MVQLAFLYLSIVFAKNFIIHVWTSPHPSFWLLVPNGLPTFSTCKFLYLSPYLSTLQDDQKHQQGSVSFSSKFKSAAVRPLVLEEFLFRCSFWTVVCQNCESFSSKANDGSDVLSFFFCLCSCWTVRWVVDSEVIQGFQQQAHWTRLLSELQSKNHNYAWDSFQVLRRIVWLFRLCTKFVTSTDVLLPSLPLDLVTVCALTRSSYSVRFDR